MSLLFTSLNSGSNGNCYYIGNEKDAVLIDAGISCRETERRLRVLGLSITKVRGIFISHEHTDHMYGARVVASKHKIPVFMSAATSLKSMIHVDPGLMKVFNPNDTISVNSLEVHAFQKLHDSIDPYSFTVNYSGVTVGVFTDIGEVCPNVIHHFGRCHAAFLEANYDEVMLDQGSYPIYLKRRIKSSTGHLSNHQALELFTQHKSPHLQRLVLAHLSQENNHPDVVEKLFNRHAGNTHINIASRYRETEVFRISE